MFNNTIYNFPLETILMALGSRKEGRNMFTSPLRDEKVASLHIDEEKNIWYDHGIGEGGTNVKLVMMAKNLSKKKAIDFIKGLGDGEALPSYTALPEEKRIRERKWEITKVRALKNHDLKQYVRKRGISASLAQRYCKEVWMKRKDSGKEFFLLAFPNNRGGFAFRSTSTFKSTDLAGISTLDVHGSLTPAPSSKEMVVFEGFFDFLSWMQIGRHTLPPCDVLVLNSVNNLAKAEAYLSLHTKIIAYLDNDSAGRRCLTKIRERFQDKEIEDMTEQYVPFKDLNEKLVSDLEEGI